MSPGNGRRHPRQGAPVIAAMLTDALDRTTVAAPAPTPRGGHAAPVAPAGTVRA